MLLVASCCLSVVILLVVSNTWPHWHSYLSAMQVYSNIEEVYKTFTPLQTPEFPAVIEGAKNITIYKQHPGFIYLGSLEYYFGRLGFKPANFVYTLICFFINLALLLRVYLKNKFKLEQEQFLMLGVLFYICADVCQPLRAVYNLVVWLPVCLIMAGYLFNDRKLKIMAVA